MGAIAYTLKGGDLPLEQWIPVVLAVITLLGTVAGGILWIAKRVIGTLTDELKETRRDYQTNVEASTKATNNLADAIREQTAFLLAERKLAATRHRAILKAIKREGGVSVADNREGRQNI